MPVFKDYVCAFQLACESYAEEQSRQFCSGDTPATKAYAAGYYFGLNRSAISVVRMVSQAYDIDEAQMDREFHTHPEQVSEHYLEAVRRRFAEERADPDHLARLHISRKMNAACWPLEEGLAVEPRLRCPFRVRPGT